MAVFLHATEKVSNQGRMGDSVAGLLRVLLVPQVFRNRSVSRVQWDPITIRLVHLCSRLGTIPV